MTIKERWNKFWANYNAPLPDYKTTYKVTVTFNDGTESTEEKTYTIQRYSEWDEMPEEQVQLEVQAYVEDGFWHDGVFYSPHNIKSVKYEKVT